MQALYDFYNPDADPEKHREAVRKAGQAADYLLLEALEYDSRIFETERRKAHGHTVRHYRWKKD